MEKYTPKIHKDSPCTSKNTLRLHGQDANTASSSLLVCVCGQRDSALLTPTRWRGQGVLRISSTGLWACPACMAEPRRWKHILPHHVTLWPGDLRGLRCFPWPTATQTARGVGLQPPAPRAPRGSSPDQTRPLIPSHVQRASSLCGTCVGACKSTPSVRECAKDKEGDIPGSSAILGDLLLVSRKCERMTMMTATKKMLQMDQPIYWHFIDCCNGRLFWVWRHSTGPSHTIWWTWTTFQPTCDLWH